MPKGTRSTAKSQGSNLALVIIGIIIGFMICRGTLNPFAVIGDLFNSLPFNLGGFIQNIIDTLLNLG